MNFFGEAKSITGEGLLGEFLGGLPGLFVASQVLFPDPKGAELFCP